jgi:hypothetical protein
MPQVLPVLHELAVLPKEMPAPIEPEMRAANFEIFLCTRALLQVGHSTSVTAKALRTSSSNSFPQSSHTNSNNGMVTLIKNYLVTIKL